MIRLFANPFVAADPAAMLHQNPLRSPRERHGGNRVLARQAGSQMRRFSPPVRFLLRSSNPVPQPYCGVAHLFFMHGSVARRSLCAPNR